MDSFVFVMIIGVICITALFFTQTNSNIEGIGALKNPPMAGFGGWPRHLYGSSDRTEQIYQYIDDLTSFMRYGDGYDERLSRPISADWSYTI